MMDIELGRVVEAYSIRDFMRQQVKKSEASLEGAKRDFLRFGRFEDCGPSYESEYDGAKQEFAAIVNLKISFEKNFKKKKLDFLEKFGEIGLLALQKQLPDIGE